MKPGVRGRESGGRSRGSVLRGFTLLEVILALGLTVIVLGLVGTAVNSTLRTIESGRRRTEREQLARAVMHRIADDLRAVVRYEPFDDSGLNSDIGGGLGGGASGGTSGASSGQAGGSTSNQNSGGNSSGGSGGSSSQNSSSQSGSQSGSDESTEETATMPVAGIYGYQNWVQLDITRIPRLDEYIHADGVNAPLQRGDVRTVTYSLGGGQNNVTGDAVAAAAMQNSTTMNATSGLARSEVDRMVSLWQTQTGGTQGGQNTVILAPEVASLEFRYFDGSTWQTQWDSTAMNGIPRAVEISLCFYDDVANAPSSANGDFVAASAGLTTNNPDNYYRMVVHLPAGIPLPAVPPVTTDDTSEESSSNNSNSGTGSSPSSNSGSGGGNTQNGGQQ
jgi:hypothetical protein